MLGDVAPALFLKLLGAFKFLCSPVSFLGTSLHIPRRHCRLQKQSRQALTLRT
jgi:hypothetical protein